MKHLQDRQVYEERYDRITVEVCRFHEKILDDSYCEGHEPPRKLTPEERETKYGVVLRLMYYFDVTLCAGQYWSERSSTIDKWVREDEEKDRRLEAARPLAEPVCQHCGRTGLRIIEKDYSYRGKELAQEDILFMFECSHCSKRSAYWQDGSDWERRHTYCPKCNAVMSEQSTRQKRVIKTKYSCGQCGHSYSDVLDLTIHDKKPDPDFEADKTRFCLTDEEGKKRVAEKLNIENICRFVKDIQQREKDEEFHNAIERMVKLTIPKIQELLHQAVAQHRYVELRFEQPEMGKDVFLPFNCLDHQTDRTAYDSRMKLKKIVTKALASTNWRLMSQGIEYRLGYLTGRLRAYDREEDLLELAKRENLRVKKSKDSKLKENEVYGKNGEIITL